MIKVYLDWNCITHIKDLFPELQELLERYENIFICPYSEANLKDVLRRSNADPEAYDHDIDILTQISNENILLLEGDKIKLYKVRPCDYLLKEKGNLETQNNRSFPYYDFRQEVRSLLNPKDIKGISKENDHKNVMQSVNDLIASNVKVVDKINAFLSS